VPIDNVDPPSESNPLVIEYVDIDSLVPDAANPRRMNEQQTEALITSVSVFGMTQPIVAQAGTRKVIGGHQRLRGARQLGHKRVPVVFVHLTDEQSAILAIALNRIGGEFDADLLPRLLHDLSLNPAVDLKLTGFAEHEISTLLRSLGRRERRDRLETFDLEEALDDAAKGPPRTERGDIWALGEHRLMCGSATDLTDVGKLMNDNHAALAVTDPPYNVSLGSHGGAGRGRKRVILNDSLSQSDWAAFVRAWILALLTSVHGPLYIFMSTKEWASVSLALEECGAHWSDTIIWTKDRFVLGRASYQRQYEAIWHGWREGAPHPWFGDRAQGDVWNFPRPAVSEHHPTTKPVPLIERAINNSSRVGDLVLDLFIGSGTTLIAAERTGRVCLGMELSARYCDVAVARWESFTGERATKV
jgi:DNA modification methylase